MTPKPQVNKTIDELPEVYGLLVSYGINLIDEGRTAKNLTRQIEALITEAKIDQVKSMVQLGEYGCNGNRLLSGYIDIDTDEINDIIAQIKKNK